MVLLLLLLTACTGEQAPSPPAPDTTAVAADTSAGPAEKTDTVFVEGMAEPVTLRRFDAPGVPFVTYIPNNDFIPEVAQGGEGTGVRFVANFGGTKTPEAHVYFFFPAQDAGLDSLGALRDYLLGPQGLATREAWQVEEPRAGTPPVCAWAAQSYRFIRTEQNQTYLGHVCLAEHAGLPFYMLVQFPEDFAEGFLPRMQPLVEEFRWRDTGRSIGEVRSSN